MASGCLRVLLVRRPSRLVCSFKLRDKENKIVRPFRCGGKGMETIVGGFGPRLHVRDAES